MSEFAARAGVPFVSSAAKPSTKGFRQAMRQLGVEPHETVVVGDQLLHRHPGREPGRRLHHPGVPIDRREFIGTRLVRLIERRVLHYLFRQGLLTPK